MGTAGIGTGASVASTGTKYVTVTSWASKGVTPVLASGKWVVTGGATKFNFFRTGLPGGQWELSRKTIFARISEAPKVPFSNSVTGQIPAVQLTRNLGEGRIVDFIKNRIFGQYRIK